MGVNIAYVLLVVVWSTTPLAIKWSATELSFSGAIFWRIAISALLAVSILYARQQRLFVNPAAWRLYTVAALGIAPNFLLIYWASLSIPSGLISVVFGTAPLMTGLLSHYWLGKKVFTKQRMVAFMIAFIGLVIVFADQLVLVGREAAYGILAVILAVIIFAVSAVGVQKIGTSVPVLQKTVGGLCFSLPLLGFVWWYLDGSMPWPVTAKAGLSVLYLAIFGSLIGFMLYYFVIQRLSAHAVSTVGMVSPVFALALGVGIEGEQLSMQLFSGAAFVLVGLIIYQRASAPAGAG